MLNLADLSQQISGLDGQLANYFNNVFIPQPDLTRSLVSFQANKNRPIYRRYKYKEAFSATLVE